MQEKEAKFIYLENLYRSSPEFASAMDNLCRNYFKNHKKLQKSLSVKNFSDADMREIKYNFGDNNVKNRSINIENFVSENLKGDETLFVSQLLKITGINEDLTAKKRNEISAALLKLKLFHEGLDFIHNYLEEKAGKGTNFFNKYSFEELDTACSIVKYLEANTHIHNLSYLGSKFCSDSHALRKGSELYSLVANFLKLETPMDTEETVDNPQLFETLGITDNPTAVKVTLYAPIVFKNRSGQLREFIRENWLNGESTTLSMDNIDNIQECFMDYKGSPELVTCENESPFNKMIREEKIPVIYTAGFPNSAVRKIISLLSSSVKRIHHWGDTDLAGLRIADIISRIIPAELWRCTLTECEKHKNSLKPIDIPAQNKAINFLKKNPDFTYAKELEFSLKNGFLEQEACENHS
ncbi:MAG TPA: hypothetical protein DD381_13570 [Lentisphaeria bacterium]|nr:MAG: hypothetical protein A2X47_03905 [Lentisphaerae bacterium GWF2_38_69]HBM17351.1 hypothetical protein [Lentisphaeria bacterium]